MRNLRLLSAFLIGAIPGAASFADEAPTETIVLDTIYLQATMSNMDPDRTGMAITLLDEEQLEAAGQVPVRDVLARLPGVNFSSAGGFGTQTTTTVRGADARYLKVLIDGIEVNDPTTITNSFDFGLLPAADFASIELLPGSNSALHGPSAVGGVLAFTTKRPTEDGFNQSVVVEAGTQKSRALTYNLTHRSGNFDQTLSITHLQRADGSVASAGTEVDETKVSRLTWTGRYAASDNLTLSAAIFVQKGSVDYDGYDYNTWLPADADNTTHYKDRGARLTAEYFAGATTHTLQYTRYEVDRTFDEAGSLSEFEGKRDGLTYRGTTNLTDNWTLVYGADHLRERATTTALVDASSTVTGVYAQGLYSNGALDASIAVRHDRNSDFGDFTTGRVAVSYAATPTMILRGAIGTGFRAPSLGERYDNYGYYVGNPNLQPEESVSYELGVDKDFMQGRISATLFRLDTDNLITYTSAVYPNTVVNVEGKSRRQGVELSGHYALNDTTTLTGNYTYVEATNAQGDRLNRVPRHTLNLGLDTVVQDVTLGINLRHVADVRDAGQAVDDYTLVDFRAAKPLTDQAEAYIRVNNVFDEDYTTNVGYNTPGRSVNFGLRAKF